MSLTTGDMSAADLAAVVGNDRNNGNGLFGGDGLYAVIVLFLIMAMMGGGFGFGGFGGFGGAAFGAGMMDGSLGGWGLYPWMNQLEATQAGFAQQSTNSAIQGLQNSVTSGFGDVQLGIAGVNQNICQTGNGIVNAVNSGFANAETSANARQMANMQQNFNSQTAITQGMNDLAMGLQNCCCENRASVADLKYTVATEACADRAAVGDALQNVTMQGVNNTNALMSTIRDGIQSIKDELCADRLEAERRENANLRSELMYARGQASQAEQTAVIQAGQRALASEVEQYVNPTPIPSYTVQNPNCCVPSCGCGCNGSF